MTTKLKTVENLIYTVVSRSFTEGMFAQNGDEGGQFRASQRTCENIEELVDYIRDNFEEKLCE